MERRATPLTQPDPSGCCCMKMRLIRLHPPTGSPPSPAPPAGLLNHLRGLPRGSSGISGSKISGFLETDHPPKSSTLNPGEETPAEKLGNPWRNRTVPLLFRKVFLSARQFGQCLSETSQSCVLPTTPARRQQAAPRSDVRDQPTPLVPSLEPNPQHGG